MRAAQHERVDACRLQRFHIALRYPQNLATGGNTALDEIHKRRACHRLGRMSGNFLDEVDDLSDTFKFQPFQHGVPQVFEQATITPYRTVHPTETFALRIEDHATGKVIAYSADTAYTEDLVDCARDAEYFLCEAAWGASAADKISGMHMSGADAGELATAAGVRNLVLTHLQPWGDTAATVQAAENYFAGPVQVALPGNEYTL